MQLKLAKINSFVLVSVPSMSKITQDMGKAMLAFCRIVLNRSI
jgi:hypothetical protein